jgi:hypothetical protein
MFTACYEKSGLHFAFARKVTRPVTLVTKAGFPLVVVATESSTRIWSWRRRPHCGVSFPLVVDLLHATMSFTRK